jgi:hypothetical protein
VVFRINDKVGSYEKFKAGFTELLWRSNQQADIQSQIYLDKHNPLSGAFYVDHYIKYAHSSSSLHPPMTDVDLLSTMTAHYHPAVQLGLLCGNFQCTQELIFIRTPTNALW